MKVKQRAMALAQKGDTTGAIKLFKKALKNNKLDLDANFMLGALYGVLGQYRDAIQYSSMAVNLSPNYTPALFNLALAYGKLEKTDKAIPLYKKVLSIEPGHVQALYDLGYLYLTMSEYTKAATYLQKHIKKSPENADAHFYIGQVYEALGNIKNAKAAYRRAANIDNTNVEHWLQLGHLCQGEGDLDQAETCFSTVLQLDQDNTDAISGKAIILEKRGDFEAARGLIEPLLSKDIIDENLGFAYYNIARNTGETTEAIAYLEKVVSKTDNTNSISLAQRALARAYDSQKRYDEAFRYFKAANTVTKKDIFSEDTREFTSSSIDFFSTETFKNFTESASDSDTPVFIVGMPRSGTTLVEQIISSHSLAYGAGELGDINELANMFHYSSIPGDQYPQFLGNGISTRLRKAAQVYIEKLNSFSNSALRVTDKMPHNFQYLGLISILFPKARIIHCKRNPIDSCLSIYFHQFNESHAYSANLEELGEHHLLYQQLMKHWKKVLPSPIFDIQYEELVNNQETISKDLISFCGLGWEENCLQFHKNERTVNTFSYDQVRKPMYTASAGKWKHYEKHLSPLIEALGLDTRDLHNIDYIRY